MDRHRADAGGRRRILVDRAERDRARARSLRSRRSGAQQRSRRTRIRPRAGGVLLRAARRAAPARLGAHDRTPLPLRGGGPRPARRAAQGRRRGARGARGQDRPRGGLPPHARRDVGRAPARRASLPRGGGRAVALRPRHAGAGAATGARTAHGTSSRFAPGGRAGRAHAGARRTLERDDGGQALGARCDVVTAAQVWAAFEEIPDPEIPVVSLVDLGVIRDVSIDGDHVHVEFTPTFLGCPALEAMKRALEEKVSQLGGDPAVAVVQDDSWSTDRITPSGRAKLRAAGFAPPSPRAACATTLVQLQSKAFRCPYCGSTETRLENIFGPTPCRSIRWCESCRQPFEQFKTI